MVAEDTTLKYKGYTTTGYVREKAGIEDDQDWDNSDVNSLIKAAETMINGVTGLSWWPYDDKLETQQAPSNIKEATAFFASAFVNAEEKDKEKTYKNHLEIAQMLLDAFMKSVGTTEFNQRLRDTVLSDYLTSPANQDAPAYITGPI